MELTYVYGYGRTKHIIDPAIIVARRDSMPDIARSLPSLCGAFGGYPKDEPERPTCKRCLKALESIDLHHVP